MANPRIALGNLNRLLASVLIPAFPSLNVTAPFLGEEGIGISFSGESVLQIPTLVGIVTSPEPYLMVSVTIHLLKTQLLAAQYKTQMESDSRLGDLTVKPDSTTLPNYGFQNTSIQNIAELRMNGKDAGYRISLGGFYSLNQALWTG